MTPQEHYDEAFRLQQNGATPLAQVHATMGVLAALIESRQHAQTCGHGTIGFCIDCLRLVLLETGS